MVVACQISNVFCEAALRVRDPPLLQTGPVAASSVLRVVQHWQLGSQKMALSVRAGKLREYSWNSNCHRLPLNFRFKYMHCHSGKIRLESQVALFEASVAAFFTRFPVRSFVASVLRTSWRRKKAGRVRRSWLREQRNTNTNHYSLIIIGCLLAKFMDSLLSESTKFETSGRNGIILWKYCH